MRLSALKAWLCPSLGCAWAGGWMNLMNLYLKNRKVHWKAPTPQNILVKTKHMTHRSTWLGVPKTFGDCPCSFVLRAYFHLWTGLASPECPSPWAMLYTFSTKGKEILMDGVEPQEGVTSLGLMSKILTGSLPLLEVSPLRCTEFSPLKKSWENFNALFWRLPFTLLWICTGSNFKQ